MAQLEGRGPLAVDALAGHPATDPTTPTHDVRRRQVLALTEAGRAVFAEAGPLWREAQRAMVERLGAEAVADLDERFERGVERLAPVAEDEA